jgi:dTDP-4-amino-4,6-dideoxygalactose transaminase
MVRAGTQAVHELGYYRNRYGLGPEDCPVADELYAQTLALPLHNKMGENDVERVVETLNRQA